MPRRLHIHQARNWIYYTAYLTLFTIAAAVFADSPWNSARKWVAIVSIILMIAIYAFDPTPRRRTLRALVRSRFRLCPRCRYDLSALDNAGPAHRVASKSPSADSRAIPVSARTVTCPECGHTSNIADTRRYWRTDWGYSRSTRSSPHRF